MHKVLKKSFFCCTVFLIFCSLFFSYFQAFGARKRGKSHKNKQVLAVVNNEPITLEEFQKKYDLVREKAFQVPSPKEFLEDLIRFKIGVQEANKTNIRQLREVQDRFDQEVYRVFIEKSIGSKVEKMKITPQEMRRFYAKNPVIHTRHILIELPPNPTQKQLKENKTRAKQICQKVKKGKQSFKRAAQLYSDDSVSKTSGGDFGYRSRFSLAHLPRYYKASLAMKKGEIRCMVRTKQGYHIIQKVDQLPFKQANKNQIKASVFDEKRVKLFHQFFHQLKKKHRIKRNLALLKKVK